jgi:hypothetical protein
MNTPQSDDAATNALVREIRGSLQGSINKISGRIREIITKPYEDEIMKLKAEIDKPRHDEHRKDLYDRLLAIFVKQSEKLCRLCEESRNLGRGSFGWLENNPDVRIEWDAHGALEGYLAKEYLYLSGREKDKEHGKLCIECGCLRYSTENKNWYCQEECEDK